MCPFSYPTCVCLESGARVVVCVRVRCVHVFAVMAALFPAAFSYFVFCEIKYHPNTTLFNGPPLPQVQS